jgi:hypothetical protein
MVTVASPVTVVLAAILFAACGGGRDAARPRTADGNDDLRRLLDQIGQLGGQEAYPVVPLELFFSGNDDVASFAPNLEPHPGIAKIYSVLRSIQDRDDVSEVLVQIDEVLDPPEWPYASSVYVITSASAQDVHEWAASIQPDELAADDEAYGWLTYAGRDRSTPPPGAPAVPPGYRPVILFWD